MVAGPPKSEAGIRRLAAPHSLLELLAAHIRRLQAPRPETLLFSELDGDLLDYSNWRHRVWLPVCKRSGLEGLVFHDLRRTNATVLVAEGVDLKTAQTRLGHSDPRLTLPLYAQATKCSRSPGASLVESRLFRAVRPRDRARPGLVHD